MKKTMIVIAVIVACAAVASCGAWRGSELQQVAISGNVELTQVNVAFKIPGKIAELLVEEGSPVQQGSVLARLDSAQLREQLNRDQAALAATESLVPQLETAIAHRRAIIAAEVELREAEVRQAEARLSELSSGFRPEEILAAEAAVGEGKSRHEQALRDWERAQVLYRNDDISTAQHDQYKARHEGALAVLQQLEQRLALAREGPRKEEIAAARARLDQALAGLKLARAANLDLKRLEQELRTRHAEVERAKAQVAIVKTQLEDTVVTSPVSGIVLVKSAEAGEIVAAGTAIASIGNLDRPWLRGYVSETDLGRVKLGDTVRVTTDSFPGKSYKGRISFIASEAEFTPKQIQTSEERVKLVYRIKVEVENPGHELKLNMPADAVIELKPR